MKETYNSAAILAAAAAAYMTLAPALIIMDSDGAYLLRMSAITVYNALLTGSIVTAILSHRNDYARWFLYGFLRFYFIAYTLSTFYFVLVYHQMVGVPMLSAILDSTPTEAGEYLRAFMNPAPVALAALLSVPPMIVFSRPARPIPELKKQERAIILGVVACLVALGLTREFVRKSSLYFVVASSVSEVLSTKKKVVATIERFKSLKAIGVENLDRRPRVHVLVLGESATRRHMSLYGYGRETNPLLHAIDTKLYIAREACSSRGATAPALQELFSYAQHDNKTPLFTEPNFIETLKAAGYRTFWISNQQTTGDLATWASIFAKSADQATFVNTMGGTDDVSHLDTRSYDDKLFAPFEAALADPSEKKFIFVHLMGSHAAYELRYPPTYARFGAPASDADKNASLLDFWRKKTADVDAYDNSVLYNDYILRTLIDMAEAHDIDTLAYLSDHGESLGENGALVGHADGAGPRQVYEIPLFFSLGKRYSADHGEIVARIRAALDRPFQSDRLTHTLLDLYAIEAPQRHAEWSLFAGDYQSAPRYCDRLAGPSTAGVSSR